MMFDWSNQEQQAGETIWGEFNESGDHIVPYAKNSKEKKLFTFEDSNKKQRNGEFSAVVGSTKQTYRLNNDLQAYVFENNPPSNTNDELSAPRLSMDTWPDLPSLSTRYSKGYTGNIYEGSMANNLPSNFSEEPNLSKERGTVREYDSSDVLESKDSSSLNGNSSFSTGTTMQLDDESALFINVHDSKGNDSFLDCDWANFENLYDLDRIFRNSPVFSLEMVDYGDGFLSPFTDVVNRTAHSILMPDIPFDKDQCFDQVCSFQFEEQSGGKVKSEEKIEDSSLGTGDEMVFQAHCTSKNQGKNIHITEKGNKQKKAWRPSKIAKEKSKNKSSLNQHGSWPHNINNSQQSFSPTRTHEQARDAEPLGHFCSYNQPMFFQYGYPTSLFPGSSLIPPNDSEITQIRHLSGTNCCVDPKKHSNYLNQVTELVSRPIIMSPQEKIEKLRRRQQMQAMLAIQQQRQQFGPPKTDNKNCSVINQNSNFEIDADSNKILSSDVNMLVEHEDSQISKLIDEHYLEESILDEHYLEESILSGANCCVDPKKHSNYLNQVTELVSRPIIMSPQEKREKLRRRQQMQAMLAIQQQQQQFGPQKTDNKNCSVKNKNSIFEIDADSNKILSSDVNMLVEHEDSQISKLIDEHYLEESILDELSDALEKLDTKVRLCIRDSLFRLARSASERRSANDRNSTHKVSRNEDEAPENEESNNKNRCNGVPDVETETNLIDRTVAHLLFYRPSNQHARQEEAPQSPISCNRAMEVHAGLSMKHTC